MGIFKSNQDQDEDDKKEKIEEYFNSLNGEIKEIQSTKEVKNALLEITRVLKEILVGIAS